MSETAKGLIVLALNTAAAVVLGLADIYAWTLDWWVPVTMIIVIILDTWAGIKWVVPNKPKE